MKSTWRPLNIDEWHCVLSRPYRGYRFPACYMLKKDGVVAYIGSSIDVLCRLNSHGVGVTTDVSIVIAPADSLARLETLLIAWYDPRDNRFVGRYNDRKWFGTELADAEVLDSLVRRIIGDSYIAAPKEAAA